MFRTGTNALRCRSRPRAIDAASAGNQTSDRFAVPRDHDFLTPLDAIQQRAEGVFGFEGADFLHDFSSI
jgi:hypothetical protein